jgi:serine/threonine-protein kinase
MTLAADICGALDFSHRNGIVHRDVKPGNVMITPQGAVKVMDFGIARAVSDSAATMTSTAAVIGTAQYLSPEQARGEGVDARSDVYSVGCLLYELVTGAPPFTGDSPVAVAYQHVREDPRLPSSINPQVPAELDAILLKAMSKYPANRYQSAAEMRNDLLRALAGQRVEATPVMNDAEKTAIIAGPGGGYGGYRDYDDDEDWEDEGEARRRRRNRIILFSVLGVLLIGGIVAAILLLRGGEAPAAERVQVPQLLNQDEQAARQLIEQAGLEVGEVTTQASTAEQQGKVINSDPASGASVEKGTKVDLVVGAGPDTLPVPNVVGLTRDEAIANIKNAGFTGPVNTEQVDSLKEAGTVVAVNPTGGSQAAPDTAFTLQLATGTIPLPDVTGKSEADARAALVDAGFSESQISTTSVERDDVAQGTVVGTNPGPATNVGAGQTIELQVAVPTPPEPTTTPPTTATATETSTTGTPTT